MRLFAACLGVMGLILGVLTIAVEAHAAAGEEATTDLARHPVVPGFERFYGDDEPSGIQPGRLLWGELGCASCHRMEDRAAALVLVKQAPLLGEVGARINPKYLRAFIADPHRTKPGTTMPNLLARAGDEARDRTVERLVHFLISLSPQKFKITGPDGDAIGRGRALFHTIGCTACHAPREDAPQAISAKPLSSVPLVALETKYSIEGLTKFLRNPLHIRPSGRMPHCGLSDAEASDLAQYLLRDTDFPAALTYRYYEGNWQQAPDFDALEPKASGIANKFDLGLQRRRNNFALVQEGFIDIPADGEYTFFTESDDGSQLFIDGKLVVDNDGVHAATTKQGKVQLAAGLHAIKATYFQGGGEMQLKVFIEGAGIARREVPSSMLQAQRMPPPKLKPFVVDPDLAAEGRGLFAELGCASCHKLGGMHQQVASKLIAPSLSELDPESGCVTNELVKGRPHYQFNQSQQTALSTTIVALKQPSPAAGVKDRIAAALATLNCYACHQRDGIGGVPQDRQALFTSNGDDLGDEGRIPPHLSGVGDKLKSDWLLAVLTKAGKARPYMNARMPQFGEANVAHLPELFATADHLPAQLPDTGDSHEAAKEAGRTLVGTGGLSCIACHMFNRHKSLGIQATDLARMPERLRKDWFHRYMLDPQPFRPGTRMPSAWPGGKSFKPDLLEGDADRQILAIYEYLADGRKALQPEGLTRQMMELIVGGEAVIYRNFIQGAGPRAIGVGYPEEVNLAFDADALRLALIWQGRFMDASQHWAGRGQGFEPPLGEKVVSLVDGPPFARLENENSPWPQAAGKEAGYQFRGYRLDAFRRPTFRYDFGEIHVDDFPAGSDANQVRSLSRTMTFRSPKPVESLWYRAAAGGKIELQDDVTFRINEAVTMRFELPADAKPVLRNTGGQPELIVPMVFEGGRTQFIQHYIW